MKKRMKVTIVVVLLLAITATLFVGCDEIFKVNAERDATQIVATVNYNGQTEHVYKFELKASFNSYAYIYVNYYGMTYEAAANTLVKSLAQQKLLTLFAKKKVAELEGIEGTPEDIRELLSDSEIDKAYKNANESFISSLKTIVENNITDDNYNNGTQDSKPSKEKVEITDPVYVRFNSKGGSDVEKIKVQKGQPADEPTDPTKSGYTFYGWYKDTECTEPYDFESEVNANITLYAKWVEYTAPRTERPEVKEDEDKDYDPDLDGVEISKDFFKYTIDELYDELKDEDFVEKIQVTNGKTQETVLKEYIGDALAELKSNMKKTIFNKTDDEGYAYYLKNQFESLLITRLQRMIGETVSVSDSEIEAEFQDAVKKNQETFDGAKGSYASALGSALSTTYFHPQDQLGYGFVTNILLKLDDESLKVLTDMNTFNPSNDEATLIERNRLISQIQVKVSNPNYKASAVIKDANGDEIELRDPMTDARNPYNKVGKDDQNTYDASKEADGGNNYNQILSFEKVDEEYVIKFNATQHEAMAYLIETVPAFDQDDQVGIIHQIHKSFKQVKDAVASGDLTKEAGVYWLREVAKEWCYLVGDDSGALSSDSNNNGLGYLITPEGEDSSFLEDFTDYARALVQQGTGSASVGEVTDNLFLGAGADGVLAGDKKVYVVADSFIESDSTQNPYAGVFVLLNTLTVWDETLYGSPLPTDGVLPLDYVITYAKDADDVKTIRQTIENTILEAKKNSAYNLEVNTFGNTHEDCISYNDKVIKEIWKDAE